MDSNNLKFVKPANVADNTNSDEDADSDIVSGKQDGALTPEKTNEGKRARSSSRSKSPSNSDDDDHMRKRKRSISKSPIRKSDKVEKIPAKKAKYSLYTPTLTQDKNSWVLPYELAHYYNKHSRVFIDDKDIKELVKEDLPVPDNIRQVPVIDNFVTATWESQNKNYMGDKDGDLVRVQNRIRDVMGPLSRVWNSIENYRAAEEGEEEEMDIDMIAGQLQKSIMLLGQATNSVTYQRRMQVLKSVYDQKTAKSMIKKHAKVLHKSTEDLFGDDFRKLLKDQSKDSKEATSFFGKGKVVVVNSQ